MKNNANKHKIFDRSILKRIRQLKRSDNWSNIFYLLADYGQIFSAILLVNTFPSFGTYIIALLLIGSRMRALENLNHETSHHHLFRHPFLNRWIGLILCGFPIGISLKVYQESHLSKHHPYLGDPEKDPDRLRYKELGIELFPISRSQLIFHLIKVFCLIHVPRYIQSNIRFSVHSSNIPGDERVARWTLWLMVMTILTIFGWWWNFILFWVLPFLTSFQIIRYLAEMSKHGGLYGSNHEIELTRNNFCHPILRFFLYPHGDYFHLVHHLFPSIPHYNLGRAHRILLYDDEYCQAHHCYGFFLPTHPDRRSTLEEMMIENNTRLKDALLQPINSITLSG